MGLTAESTPLALTSTSWPALTVCFVVPLTLTEPTNTLKRFVLFCLTSTSNWVPRTSALTEWPSILNVEPLARCWTLTSVRPAFCATSTASRLPAFCSWTLVIWTSVLGDIRTYEPSGNWMAA